MLRLWVYRYLNDRFGQVGDVGNMCPATLFKLLDYYYSENLIWNHTMYVHMELLLLLLAWNYIYLLERT